MLGRACNSDVLNKSWDNFYDGLCYSREPLIVILILIDWLIWHHTGIAQKQEKRPCPNTQKSRTTYREHDKHFLRHKTPVSVRNQPYSSIWHQRYLTKSSGRSESSWHRRQCVLRRLHIPPFQLIQAKVCPSATCTHLAASKWSRPWKHHHWASSSCIPSEVPQNTHKHTSSWAEAFKIHLQNRQQLRSPFSF